MVKDDILEIHQYRKPIPPRIINKDVYRTDYGLTSAADCPNCPVMWKTGVTERRYGVEAEKLQFLVYIHPHRAVNIAPNSEHARPLYRQCKAEDIDQCGQQ